jgi:hypothetical protein
MLFRSTPFVCLLVLASLIFPRLSFSQYEAEYVTVPVNISLIPGVSIGDLVAADGQPVINYVSLSLLGGRAAKLRGIELAGLYTHYTESAAGVTWSGLFNRVDFSMFGLQVAGAASVAGTRMTGVQVSGFGSLAGVEVTGAQVSGFASAAGGNVSGIQVAGFGNLAGADFFGIQVAGAGSIAGRHMRGGQISGGGNIAGSSGRGVQVAGLGNIVGDRYRGVQSAALGNVVGDDLNGVQVAGLLNIVGGDVQAAQVSGLGNIVGGAQRGVQVAGLFNINGGEVHGIQIAPVNLAPVVRGVQVGIFNRAEAHTGFPIGLVTEVRDVGFRYDIHADEVAVFTGLRSGNRRISNYLMVGWRPGGERGGQVAFQTGLGLETPVTALGAILVDALQTGFLPDFDDPRLNMVARLRVAGLLKVGTNVGLLAGPALSIYVSETGHGVIDAPVWGTLFDTTSGRHSVRSWIGFGFGIRFYGP